MSISTLATQIHPKGWFKTLDELQFGWIRASTYLSIKLEVFSCRV